ncbi:hypothetical protein P167DRAFT_531948 [Morchella conica CCBAS932]|uniref:Uncharacterized protein n=1 Tax=Morchella conica CCBAS932 TaxID=1392247 RepID=A0A3N4L2F1_9PEZI|nr:hypothetical protein P167DRAFT_531948 [Morchella conica CCBAS932]
MPQAFGYFTTLVGSQCAQRCDVLYVYMPYCTSLSACARQRKMISLGKFSGFLPRTIIHSIQGRGNCRELEK